MGLKITVGTILSRDFYINKMIAGGLYQAQLSMNLKNLGISVEKGIGKEIRWHENRQKFLEEEYKAGKKKEKRSIMKEEIKE